jgi:hypothetical protein
MVHGAWRKAKSRKQKAESSQSLQKLICFKIRILNFFGIWCLLIGAYHQVVASSNWLPRQ